MDSFSTTAQELTIEHLQTGTVNHNGSVILEDDGHFIRIGSNGKYLCQYGGPDVNTYGAENSNGDSGNAMWFHQVQNGTTTKVTYGELEVAPSEPEQPAIGSEVVFFPVTMFNYNNGISELNEDAIMRNLTHQAEVEAGLKEKWEGLYFSGGKPAPTPYTYTTEAASHSDLSWQQVMDGTYYADAACTNRVAVNTIGDASSEYTLTYVAVGDIWNSRGNEVNVAGVNAFETNYYCLYNNNYYHVYIRNSGNSYYVQYLRNGILYGAGNNGGYAFLISVKLSLYENNASVTGYTLVAGGKTLATLYGTDLTAKVGVPLYTAAGEVTVNKSYAEWNWWAYETANDAARNKFYAGLVQDELVDGELKFNVPEPGIFTFDSAHPEITNDGIKDSYQHVGLPFV